jgi:hypothetical protein
MRYWCLVTRLLEHDPEHGYRLSGPYRAAALPPRLEAACGGAELGITNSTHVRIHSGQ